MGARLNKRPGKRGYHSIQLSTLLWNATISQAVNRKLLHNRRMQRIRYEAIHLHKRSRVNNHSYRSIQTNDSRDIS